MNSQSLVIFKRSAYAAFACICALAGTEATAAIVTPTAAGTVTITFAFTNYAGGDFVFSTSTSAPGCATGWYISPTDAGYKAAVAAVLTAQAGGNYVVVYADNSQLWPGSPSGGQYCHVVSAGMTT